MCMNSELIRGYSALCPMEVLEKCGVPPKLLSFVNSYHEGMHAEVRIGTTTMPGDV